MITLESIEFFFYIYYAAIFTFILGVYKKNIDRIIKVSFQPR